MQIKLMTDYTLRMLTYLATKQGITNSKQISDELGIPQKNVLSIGRKLKAKNYIEIISGPYGGYKIAKNPENICLFDIVFMFEGIGINYRSEANQTAVNAAVNNFYSELQGMIKENLNSRTLADLISMNAVHAEQQQ